MNENKSPIIRDEVMRFAEAMELELQRHDKKKGKSWKDINLFRLEAMIKEASVTVEMEGQDIDIANLCMMHFDNERRFRE